MSLSLYCLGDRVELLIENKGSGSFGEVVAISTIKADPADVLFGIRFDEPNDVGDVLDCIDAEQLFVDDDILKWDFKSTKAILVEYVFNIKGMLVAFWFRPEEIKLVKSALKNNIDEEDRGGLKYL